jgi:NitT/TauT family transport system ATP-binding protein
VAALILDNVTKHRTGSADRALSTGFSLVVKEGEHVLLLGGNGVGKSTILDIAAGLELPDSGTATSKSNNRAYVPQHFSRSLVPWCSAEWNILEVAKHRRRLEDIRRDLSALSKAFELDFSLEQRAGKLSGGQQQLVCILRALVTRPSLLIMDEPQSMLSQYRCSSFRSALKQHFSTCAWLMTSHRPEIDRALFDREITVGQSTLWQSAAY